MLMLTHLIQYGIASMGQMTPHKVILATTIDAMLIAAAVSDAVNVDTTIPNDIPKLSFKYKS